MLNFQTHYLNPQLLYQQNQYSQYQHQPQFQAPLQWGQIYQNNFTFQNTQQERSSLLMNPQGIHSLNQQYPSIIVPSSNAYQGSQTPQYINAEQQQCGIRQIFKYPAKRLSGLLSPSTESSNDPHSNQFHYQKGQMFDCQLFQETKDFGTLKEEQAEKRCVSTQTDPILDSGVKVETQNEDGKHLVSKDQHKTLSFIQFKKSTERKRKCLKITRKKLTKFQKNLLSNEFQRDPNWSKDKMAKLAKFLDMKLSTIYKWNYDQKVKVLNDKSKPEAEIQLIKSVKDQKQGHLFKEDIVLFTTSKKL